MAPRLSRAYLRSARLLNGNIITWPCIFIFHSSILSIFDRHMRLSLSYLRMYEWRKAATRIRIESFIFRLFRRIQKLFKRLNSCTEGNGDYVEK